MEGEEAANSARSSGSDDWQPLPGEAEAPTNELATFWRKKAEEQERLRLKAESEVIEFRSRWQQQVQEAEARKQEAKEEALMWQDKAAQQSALRANAEAAATKWENKAEREEGLRRKAERDAAESEQKAEREASWRRLWEEKAMAEESLCTQYQQRAQTADGCLKHWQKKVDEQASLLEEKGKALEQERAFRKVAEASATKWQTKARNDESCREKAEQDLEEWKQKAEAEEAFREKCERKANAEASLRKEWQEKALQREQDMEARFLKEFEEKLKVKDAQLAEAEAATSEWQSKAEQEGQCRKTLEQEVETWKKKAEDEERLKETSEVKVEALAHELKLTKTKKVEEMSCMDSGNGLGHYCVDHTFQNIQAARRDRKELWSPELCFRVPEEMRFSYGFRLLLYPNSNSTKDTQGAMGLYWSPLPGSGELHWPFPCDKAKIVLRIVSSITAGAEGTKKCKVKEVVLDEGSEGFRHFVATNSPPWKDNINAFGDHELLTKAEFEAGGWTSGLNFDDLIVQAELVFK